MLELFFDILIVGFITKLKYNFDSFKIARYE